MRKKGFTLIELLVVIAIIAMLLAILMPALSKVKKIAMRVVCATNLKGLGTAQTVYANDYDDQYAVQGGSGAHTLGPITNGYADVAKQWGNDAGITTGASLYLLVREADVSPKSFLCPSGDQKEWDGKIPGVTSTLDIVEFWDFGNYNVDNTVGPMNCVSYSYHQPYVAGDTLQIGKKSGQRNRYAADGTRSAAFAVMADRNPYFDNKLEIGGVTQQNYIDRVRGLIWQDTAEKWEILVANAQPHDREGQNVLFADGHSSNENRTDVSVKNDNIYTKWSGVTGNDESEWRTGAAADKTQLGYYPRSSNDSVLVNDDDNGTLE